jgi:DUF4097 and DUF4098 domain-containing protein YvlB
MERTFETPGRVWVVVENMVGQVSLATGDPATTRVTLTADAPDAQELVDRAVVECDQRGGRNLIRVKVPKRHGPRFMRRNGVTVRISLPADADVEAATASADVDLTGVFGDLKLTTASGDIDVNGRAHEVEATTASGSIVLGRCNGRVRGKSASGDFRIAESEGPVTVTTASGNLEVGAASAGVEMRCTSGDMRLGAIAGDVHVVGVSGDVEIRSYSEGHLRARSVSGDVEIGIAPGVNLAVDVESMSGTVSSDIPLGEQPTPIAEAPEVFVSAQTVSGDVLIARAAATYAQV